MTDHGGRTAHGDHVPPRHTLPSMRLPVSTTASDRRQDWRIIRGFLALVAVLGTTGAVLVNHLIR